MNSAIKNNSINKNEKGFSLLEVIFAMTIITSGIISILSLFNYNLKAEVINKNKLVATYLAQEAIEVVRQTRDNIWFNGDDSFLDESDFNDDEVIVGLVDKNDIREGWEIEASNVNRKKVYLSEDSDPTHFTFGSYVQLKSAAPGSWKETGFERYLEIANGSDGSIPSGCDITSCMRIISHVSFNGVEMAKITAYLYDDWY